MTLPPNVVSGAVEVLTVFLIPFGGGIPAGVLLAKSRGIDWPLTTLLYLFSDMILACLFEPMMYLFIKYTKHTQFFARWAQAYKTSINKSGFKYGRTSSPLSLIILSFGVDPMTGRAAARAAGHRFMTGWTLAICGDMIFFVLIMASTLWLNNILGNGTWAAVIIMVLMIVVPLLIERCKARKS
jgi:hypothetical protein